MSSACAVPGELAYRQFFKSSRSCGAALCRLPAQLRTLAQDNDAALAGYARARSAQALAQALVCALLVPSLRTAPLLAAPRARAAPRSMVPGLRARGCFRSRRGGGALWMLAIADRATVGGLPGRSASVDTGLGNARANDFVALVRSGNPADRAHGHVLNELLHRDASGLAERWGRIGVEAPPENEAGRSHAPSAIRALEEAGRRLAQGCPGEPYVAGAPASERVETGVEQFAPGSAFAG